MAEFGSGKSGFSGPAFDVQFEPSGCRLLAERKPQSINLKRLFAKQARRTVSHSSRSEWRSFEPGDELSSQIAAVAEELTETTFVVNANDRVR